MLLSFVKRIFFPTICIMWATTYFIEVLGKPESARYLIFPVYFFLLSLYFSICFFEYQKIRVDTNHRSNNSSAGKIFNAQFLAWAATCVYVALIPYFGFIAATGLFLAFSVISLGAKSKAKALILALLFTTSIYYLFETFFFVQLPKGFWR